MSLTAFLLICIAAVVGFLFGYAARGLVRPARTENDFLTSINKGKNP